MKRTVNCLAALAQETRLAIFRLLVQAGPAGLCAGDIGARLRVAPATLSFHLAQLTRAGVTASRAQGRFVIYRADFGAMAQLLEYLTEDCCGGRACLPVPVAPPRKRKAA